MDPRTVTRIFTGKVGAVPALSVALLVNAGLDEVVEEAVDDVVDTVAEVVEAVDVGVLRTLFSPGFTKTCVAFSQLFSLA
jgi:hypothetical protein